MFFFSFFVQDGGSVCKSVSFGRVLCKRKRFDPLPAHNFYHDHLPFTVRVRLVTYGDVNDEKRPPIKKIFTPNFDSFFKQSKDF